jgi:protein-tyrosine phosphatase
MIDFHSHLMPGVDDGAVDLDQSRAALLTMREQGVTAAITTPHLSGSLLTRPAAAAPVLAEIDRAWKELEEMVAAEMPGFRIERGAEIELDSTVLELGDARARMAGTRFVLVEFPHMSIPPNSERAIFEMRMKGLSPVIAHPERYSGLDAGLEVVEEWVRVGGLLQVNCGSLLGRYGASAEQIAWRLLERGRVSYLASDYHARGRCPIREARDVLTDRGAEESARLLMEENPALLLRDERPHPVPPLALKKRTFLERLGLRRGR